MSVSHRFQDANLRMDDFTNEVLVECPQCRKQAVVKQLEKGEAAARLSCPSCHFQTCDNMVRYDILLNARCNECVHAIKLEKRAQKEFVDSITITCPKCKSTETYHPKVIEIRIAKIVNTGAYDPYFGCPLWLQAPFKDELFWANNYKHLDYLKQYIGAGLRERNDRAFFTLVEKLPSFIQSAKNRDRLLKLINKLRKR